MARLKRIDLPFTLYHVLSRTNSGDDCFATPGQRAKYFYYLAKYSRIFSLRIHAWCLMPNHFHLLLESDSQPVLSEFMRRLLTAYTIYFNRREERHGHLFQGRFKSYVVDKASYLLTLSRYIHLNPPNPEKFEGSSLRYYLNGNEPDFLYTKEVLSWFKGDRKKYREFIREGFNENTKPEIMKRRFVSGASFAKRCEKRLKQTEQKGSGGYGIKKQDKLRIDRIYLEKAESLQKIIADYFNLSEEEIRKRRWYKSLTGKARTILIYIIHDQIPWTYSRIAEFMGISGKSVISYHLRRVEMEKTFKTVLKEIILSIKKIEQIVGSDPK